MNFKIVTLVLVKLERITISIDIEVTAATSYIVVFETDWLCKADTLLDYRECAVTLWNNLQMVWISCRNTWEVPPSDNNEEDKGDEEEDNEGTGSEDNSDETNFVDLIYELPDQENNVIYKLTSERVYASNKFSTWETYDHLACNLENITNKKKQRPQTFRGLNLQCWCNWWLETAEDWYKECEVQIVKWEESL